MKIQYQLWGYLTLVINFAALEDMHSRTIENAPAFSIDFASFKSLKTLSFETPSILNFFLNCGVYPICPSQLFYF